MNAFLHPVGGTMWPAILSTSSTAIVPQRQEVISSAEA
jgi:hypothetical protein